MSIIKKNQAESSSSMKVIISTEEKVDPKIISQEEIEANIKYNKMITEADNRVKEAKLEAQRIVSKAKRETEELRKATKETAQQEGYNQGFEAGKSEYEKLIAETEQIKEKTQQLYYEALKNAEEDIVEIIISVAKKFISDNILTDKSKIYDLVKDTIENCSQRKTVVVKVSNEDLSYLELQKERLLTDITGIDSLTLIGSDELDVGSCIVESENGSINSSIDIRLQKIENSLKQILISE